MEPRSTIRWQHRLKREHPTCTERTKSLTEECGWKGGDSRRLGGRKNLVDEKQKTHLTPTGLLMEGVSATLRLLFARPAKGKRKLVLSRCFANHPSKATPTVLHSLTCPFHPRKIRAQ